MGVQWPLVMNCLGLQSCIVYLNHFFKHMPNFGHVDLQWTGVNSAMPISMLNYVNAKSVFLPRALIYSKQQRETLLPHYRKGATHPSMSYLTRDSSEDPLDLPSSSAGSTLTFFIMSEQLHD